MQVFLSWTFRVEGDAFFAKIMVVKMAKDNAT